jgi:hypothetical protein
MFVVSGPGSICLVFVNREDLENVVKNLQIYIDDKTEPDNAIRVYAMSDERLPVHELEEIAYFVKERFSTHERARDFIQ